MLHSVGRGFWGQKMYVFFACDLTGISTFLAISFLLRFLPRYEFSFCRVWRVLVGVGDESSWRQRSQVDQATGGAAWTPVCHARAGWFFARFPKVEIKAVIPLV